MLTIQLQFPTGKWHATPWGRQVNEGAVEWPPSPWRLLRSLIAVWHHKHPSVPEAEVRGLIRLMGESLPVYHLPETGQGHTRHYMPIANDKRTKIFDTFLTIPPKKPLLIHWPNLELSSTQQKLLEQFLESMSYFGRAESWVIAGLTGWEHVANAQPLNGERMPEDQEVVRLLAVGNLSEYDQWRKEARNELESQKLAEKKARSKSPDKAKLTKKDHEQIEASLPIDLFDSLQMDTSDLRKAGWNRPPASEWIPYVRPRSIPAIDIAKKGPTSRQAPTVARFAIAGALRPRMTDALFLGERVRESLMSISDGAFTFSGRHSKTQENKPETGHRHAHYLSESINNPTKRITHITVFVPNGFDCSDEKNLNRFQKTWGKGGHDLQYVLIGLGDPEDFGGLDERKGHSPILAESDHWTSLTPFVPADRLRRKYRLNDPVDKKKCEKDLLRIIRKEFQRRDWLSYAADMLKGITCLPPDDNLAGPGTTCLKYRRERIRGGGRRGNASGFGLELAFHEKIRGPIALGYGSHFGLGLFVPKN